MPENLDKSRHPDLTDGGELRGDAYQDTPRRDFNRMARDPSRWQAFMDSVARDQAELDPWVQQQISGRSFGTADDPYGGYLEYQREVRLLRDTLGDQRTLSGRDIERMSMEEYDQHFDSRGQPRRGVVYRPTGGRDVDITNTGVDRFSQRELGQGR